MKWLVVSVILLSGIFTTGIGLARVVGRNQPNPESVELLRLTECELPCWVVITPGHTTARDTVQRFADAFAVPAEDAASAALSSPTQYSQFLLLVLPRVPSAPYEVPVQLVFINGMTTEIRIPGGQPQSDLAVPILRLGDIASLFGAPTCVISMSFPGSVSTFYFETPQGIVEAAVIEGRASHWLQPILYLSLHTPPQRGRAV